MSTHAALPPMPFAALRLTPPARSVRVVPSLQDVGSALTAADLVLSRAGAATVAELHAARTPCLLVPSPALSEEQQAANAQVLADTGGWVCKGVGAHMRCWPTQVGGCAGCGSAHGVLADKGARRAVAHYRSACLAWVVGGAGRGHVSSQVGEQACGRALQGPFGKGQRYDTRNVLADQGARGAVANTFLGGGARFTCWRIQVGAQGCGRALQGSFLWWPPEEHYVLADTGGRTGAQGAPRKAHGRDGPVRGAWGTPTCARVAGADPFLGWDTGHVGCCAFARMVPAAAGSSSPQAWRWWCPRSMWTSTASGGSWCSCWGATGGSWRP